MRFLHTADLHIGKVLHKHSFLEDQKHILKQIQQIAKEQQVDAVLIAGDVYQRNTPSPEAMTVFSDFLSGFAAAEIPCYIISGNHDAAERVSYLSALAKKSGIYIADAAAGAIDTYTLTDEWGPLTIHLLSHCTPLQIRQRYPEAAAQIETYEDAVTAVLAQHPMPLSGRHVLVCHQFLTGASVCDSEELAIGGMDNIPASLFEMFDYVALGHLHGPQAVTRPTVRYAGSPLKYSFSETAHKKSVTIVDIKAQGEPIDIQTVPLQPLHDMIELRGSFDELMQHTPCEDYAHLILTNETPPVDAQRQLRTVFPHLLHMSVQNSKLREDRNVAVENMPEQSDFLALLREFYAFQNNGAVPSESQTAYVRELLERMDEGETVS